MPLHPQAKALLDAMPEMPDFAHLKLGEIRASMDGSALAGGEVEPVARVEDTTIPGPAGEIPVRVYTPEGTAPFPGLMYFHGGGFVLCDLDTHDATCRSLAKGAGCVVVSVDYRLAPEHAYPAAADDCHAATRWVSEHAAEWQIDPARLAVAGDSAGGNLAAVTTLRARDEGLALAYQLLIYPVTDCDFDTVSYRENGKGYFLTEAMMRWFWEQYLQDDEQAREAHASPLRADDVSKLPPGLCITAQYDPLRDEGEAYAQRLRSAGVELQTSRYDGVFHGFFAMTTLLDPAKEAMSEACEALRKALS